MSNLSLSDRIAARMKKQGIEPNSNKNQIIFMQNMQEIKDAIMNGWTMKVIWEVLIEENKFTASYASFVSYVRRYIGTKKFNLNTMVSLQQPDKSIEEIVSTEDIMKPTIKTSASKPPETFTYNAEPLKDDDLY